MKKHIWLRCGIDKLNGIMDDFQFTLDLLRRKLQLLFWQYQPSLLSFRILFCN